LYSKAQLQVIKDKYLDKRSLRNCFSKLLTDIKLYPSLNIATRDHLPLSPYKLAAVNRDINKWKLSRKDVLVLQYTIAPKYTTVISLYLEEKCLCRKKKYYIGAICLQNIL